MFKQLNPVNGSNDSTRTTLSYNTSLKEMSVDKLVSVNEIIKNNSLTKETVFEVHKVN